MWGTKSYRFSLDFSQKRVNFFTFLLIFHPKIWSGVFLLIEESRDRDLFWLIGFRISRAKAFSSWKCFSKCKVEDIYSCFQRFHARRIRGGTLSKLFVLRHEDFPVTGFCRRSFQCGTVRSWLGEGHVVMCCYLYIYLYCHMLGCKVFL